MVRELERLGRREDDETAAAFEPVQRGATLGGAQSAVEHDDRDTTAPECPLLVRHEGDEGRDDDRRPLKDHRWNLIDQRLPKAGRERHQRVASFQDGEHRRFLLGPEAFYPECPARRSPARIEQAHDMASQRQHGFNPNEASTTTKAASTAFTSCAVPTTRGSIRPTGPVDPTK